MGAQPAHHPGPHPPRPATRRRLPDDPPSRRRALHATAATLVNPDAAWAHKVAATDTTDPHLAQQLAAEATRLADQRNFDRAATLELWAADLVPTRDQHEAHLTTAVTHLLTGDGASRARTLRGDLEACVPTPARDAALGFIAGVTEGDFITAEPLLTGAITHASDDTTRQTATRWLGTVYNLEGDWARASQVLRPLVTHTPTGLAADHTRFMIAMAEGLRDGPTAALKVIAAAGIPDEAQQVAHADSLLLSVRGMMRISAGQLGSGIDDLTVLADRQHADANLNVLPQDHLMLSLGRYLTGRWESAAINADNAVLTAETSELPWGLPPAYAAAVLVHAQRGHQDTAQAHLEACRQASQRFLEHNGQWPLLGEAAVAQARADHPAMLHSMQNTVAGTAPAGWLGLVRALWIPLYIEAVTADDHLTPDDLRQAGQALDTFDRLAENAPALTATIHWLHGRLAAARHDAATAAEHYRRGLATPVIEGDDIPLHRAFLHRDLAHHLLATGTPRDRDDAATHLRQALEVFTTLDAIPHKQRADNELAALTGQPAKPEAQTTRGTVPGEAMTEREHAIAYLAAQGLTNQEIGRELYVSAKTVEYHLSHIFPKLGITSRRQLRTSKHLTPA